MGWTGYHATHYKPNGTIDRKAELDYELFTQWAGRENAHELLKSTMVGSTYYAAARSQSGNVYGLVVLTSVDSKEYFNFNYKDMSEDMGPCEDNCPVSILNLLSPTDNEYAMDWRRRCRKRAEFAKLPVGTRIRITYRGNPMELVRHGPKFQFKRPFWYNPERNTYLPANRIPTDYEVIA